MRFLSKHKLVNILTAIFFANTMVMPIAQPIAYAEEVVSESSTKATITDLEKYYLENFDNIDATTKEKFADQYSNYIYTLYRTSGSSEDKDAYKSKLLNASSATEAQAIINEGKTYTSSNVPTAEWTKQLSNWSNLGEFDRMNLLQERIDAIDSEGLLSKAGVDKDLIKQVISSDGFTVNQLDSFIDDYVKAQTQINETSSNASSKQCPSGYFEVPDVKKCCPTNSTYDTETQMCKTTGDSTSGNSSGGGSNSMATVLPLAGVLLKGGFGGGSASADEDPVPPEVKDRIENVERGSVDGKYKNALKKGNIQIAHTGTVVIDGKEDYLFDSAMNSVVYSTNTSDKQYLVLVFSDKSGKLSELGDIRVQVEAMPKPVWLQEEKSQIPQPVIKAKDGQVVKRFIVDKRLLESENGNGFDITVMEASGKFQLPIKGAIKVLNSAPILGNGQSGATASSEVLVLDGSDNTNLIDFEDGDVTFDDGVCMVPLKNGKQIETEAENFSDCEDKLKEFKGRYFDDAQVKEDGTITAEDYNEFKTNEDINRNFQIETKDGYKSVFTADMTAFTGADGKAYFLDTTTGKVYNFSSPPEVVEGLEVTTEIQDDGNYIIKDKNTGETIPQTSVSNMIRISKTEPPAQTAQETPKQPESSTGENVETKNRAQNVRQNSFEIALDTANGMVEMNYKNRHGTSIEGGFSLQTMADSSPNSSVTKFMKNLGWVK